VKYSYFPGCSLKGTGRAYEESLLPVFKALGVDMTELDDWNCCGATAYMSVDEVKAAALAGRNLALAEKAGGDLMAPCAACYLVLMKTQKRLEEYPAVRGEVGHALGQVGLSYEGKVKVRHPLDILVNDIGVEVISKKVVKPLKGLKVAPYYGCQIVRPYATFDNQENPQTMDKLLRAVGAEVVDYPMKTKCCGGSLTGTLPEVGVSLVHGLLREASRRGADVISTVCPLCQFNLDCFQDRVSSNYEKSAMPVVYITQLLGLALGLPMKELGLHRGVVSVEPILAQRELLHV